MDEARQETIDTYNKSAAELAKYFRGIGSRVEDIEYALQLAGNVSNPKIVEIGCGDGRDAKEILKHTTDYVGFDISEELIKLAQAYAPEGEFELADAATYQYPLGLNVVFAFASLLHSDKDEVKDVIAKVHNALVPKGVFFISLKYMPEYAKKYKEDQYGRRLFYFYNPELISELAGTGFTTEKVNHHHYRQHRMVRDSSRKILSYSKHFHNFSRRQVLHFT